MTDHLVRFPLPNGHTLWTNSGYSRGAIAAPFGCALVRVIDLGERLAIEGIGKMATYEEALAWMTDEVLE